MTLCRLYALLCRWHRLWRDFWSADHRYRVGYDTVSRQINSCDALKRGRARQ